MNKRVLMVTLSMALVVGLAGIVNAATMGNNSTDTQSQVPNASAYVNHNKISSMGTGQETTSQTSQTLPVQTTQVQPTQTDQILPSQTDINTPMKSANVSMNNQVQNMPVTTQMPTMAMNASMNGQMSNSQNMQGIEAAIRSNPTNASSVTPQSGQKSSGNTMMRSTGRMNR